MSRGYPRFLYSNPQNTKNKGPFIVYLLEPRLVFGIVEEEFPDNENILSHKFMLEGRSFALILLDKVAWDDKRLTITLVQIIKDAVKWFHNQVRDGSIQLPVPETDKKQSLLRAAIEHSKDNYYSGHQQFANVAQRAFIHGVEWKELQQ